MYEFAYIKHS